jgi:hypothetical protein
MRVAPAQDSVLLREGMARLLADAGRLGLPATGSESRRVLVVLLFLRG